MPVCPRRRLGTYLHAEQSHPTSSLTPNDHCLGGRTFCESHAVCLSRLGSGERESTGGLARASLPRLWRRLRLWHAGRIVSASAHVDWRLCCKEIHWKKQDVVSGSREVCVFFGNVWVADKLAGKDDGEEWMELDMAIVLYL